jgi:eukaryotic-like serine/threonine-protein kinase
MRDMDDARDRSTQTTAAIVRVPGLIDENFSGFGELGATKQLVIDLTHMTQMTSFGVRQWISSMNELSRTVSHVYLLGCPTFFVEQLNMVLNLSGAARVLTAVAPYKCAACGAESNETVDVLDARDGLLKGNVPDKRCSRCGEPLAFDDVAESYFTFVGNCGATNLETEAAELLASMGLYTSRAVTAVAPPPRIIKLVHGQVTYFRVAGTMGSNFRARPILVGAEGEVVIDLADIESYDAGAHKEWRRLLRSLSGQVSTVTLVDLSVQFFAFGGDTLAIARNLVVASVLVQYRCAECQRRSFESVQATWPVELASVVCSTCGGDAQAVVDLDVLRPLEKASVMVPKESAKLIAQRGEILSRALTDARVAEAGPRAGINEDETILGKYKIVRQFSEGGMAEIFLAKQLGIGGFEKPVALKRIQRKLLESRHLAIDMFLNEAKIAGRLMHPNIVQVLDVGEVQGALYLAMEYVHGKDLRALSSRYKKRRETIPLPDVLFIVREVAVALHHAYFAKDIDGKQLAVVHRDVSPQNVILGYDGAVKLLDFGVATSSVTEHDSGMIVGKWRYLSPEATSKSPIDHRSDLFSLGVILYSLCTGVEPFVGRDPREIVKKIRAGAYKPVGEVAPHLPKGLSDLISSLLQAAPQDRPRSGQEVVTRINEIARDNGFEMSSWRIAHLLEELFPIQSDPLADEPDIEIIRPSRADSSLSRVTGSYTLSSISSTPRPGGKTDLTHTITPTPGPRFTPTQFPSLAAPRVVQSTDVSRPVPPPPVPLVSKQQRRMSKPVGTLIIMAIAIALIAVLYFVVHPV